MLFVMSSSACMHLYNLFLCERLQTFFFLPQLISCCEKHWRQWLSGICRKLPEAFIAYHTAVFFCSLFLLWIYAIVEVNVWATHNKNSCVDSSSWSKQQHTQFSTSFFRTRRWSCDHYHVFMRIIITSSQTPVSCERLSHVQTTVVAIYFCIFACMWRSNMQMLTW